jgi:MFS family permease
MSSTPAEATLSQPSFIRTRIGVLTLLLLCGVQFLDVVDSSITNVAFPSIQRALHFSQQNLQWVASGCLLTYGGFLLLGGRLADLLGRRRILVAGLVVFAVCSLAAGFAQTEGVLIGARVLQGGGAAMLAPAALSILGCSGDRQPHPQRSRRRAAARCPRGRSRAHTPLTPKKSPPSDSSRRPFLTIGG